MIDQSYYDEAMKENEELLKNIQELKKEYDNLKKEYNKLKSENEKLKENLKHYLFSSSSKNDSLSSNINGDQNSIIFLPENKNIEAKKGILSFSENDSHFICRKCHKVPIIEFSEFKNNSTNSNSTINSNSLNNSDSSIYSNSSIYFKSSIYCISPTNPLYKWKISHFHRGIINSGVFFKFIEF